jgi:uncharacterized membrane protein YjfL (UPF0719 family)
MSSDEVMVLVVSAVCAAICWGRWFSALVRTSPLLGGTGRRALLGGAAVACAGLLWVLLRCFSASDVRDSNAYMILYEILGAGWVGLSAEMLARFGVRVRDDAIERRNDSAAYAVGGALIGLTLAFAGANFGNGPGWWVVVFAALLSTGGLLLAWLIVQVGSDALEAITVERDQAAGVRIACFYMACGLVLCRAVAGDWVSAVQTVADFVPLAWPVLVLAALEIAVGRLCRPAHPPAAGSLLSTGVIPGLAYLAGAAGWVWTRGAW